MGEWDFRGVWQAGAAAKGLDPKCKAMDGPEHSEKREWRSSVNHAYRCCVLGGFCGAANGP
jgi:hypothetical protein